MTGGADVSRYVDEYLAFAARYVDPGARWQARQQWFMCRYCDRAPELHAGEQCLFAPDHYAPRKHMTRAETTFKREMDDVDYAKL